MENIIVAIVLVAMVGAIVWYLYKAKKSGKKCIGCPYGASCSKSGGGCDCHKDDSKKQE
ncbi:MAG: FeoB-associated Cys-rich membrane protein [Clostridia bacterium]|nr:FeoB-associated Cys-rich membrane protein [Clostridia bacterium]